MKYYTEIWKSGDPLYTEIRDLPLDNEIVELIESKDVERGCGTIVIKIKAGLFRIRQPYCLIDWKTKIASRKTHLIKCRVGLTNGELYAIFPYQKERYYYNSLDMMWSPWKQTIHTYVINEKNACPESKLLGVNGIGCSILDDDYIPLSHELNISSAWDVLVLFGGGKQVSVAYEVDEKGRLLSAAGMTSEELLLKYKKLDEEEEAKNIKWSIYDASTTAVK